MFLRRSRQGRKQFRQKWQNRRARALQVELLEDRALLSGTFQALAFLGDPAPGTGAGGSLTHTFDWEPGDINDRGQVVFGSDLSTVPGDAGGANGIGEGVFLQEPNGQRVALARVGDTAPDGATYQFYFAGEIQMNQRGDGAFVFSRDPLPAPFIIGVNSGLYRFSGPNHEVTPALLPGYPAPGGGTFSGYAFRPTINDPGNIAFVGIVPTNIGPGASVGLGQGNFLLDSQGHVSTIVRPGDTVTLPGGRTVTFDWAQNPSLNNRGDVAFGAHITDDPFIQFGATFPATLIQIFTAESVYLRDAQTGTIRPIAVQGGPAPGGKIFTYAFGPVLNNAGDIAFGGAFPADPPGTGLDPINNDNNIGVFLNHKGENISVAQPGDPMPGGGHLKTAGFFTLDLGLNDQGTVSFSATLDTDMDHDGVNDTGLFTWSRATLSVVARTGTVIPGVGTIQSLAFPAGVGASSSFGGGEAINNRGQILFQATLTDGRGVLLLYTPTGTGSRLSAVISPSLLTSLTGRSNNAPTETAISSPVAPQTGTGPSEISAPLVLSSSSAGRSSRGVSASTRAASRAANISLHEAVDDFFASFAEGPSATSFP